MDSKILIALAVIGAILLAGLFAPRTEETAPILETGQLIEAGHFVLEQAGTPVVNEEYTLFFSPADGYMLLSEARVTTGDQTISLAQQYQFDRVFLPILYHLAAATPSGSQIISAQIGLSGLHMETRAGTAQQSVDIPDARNTAILDNNLVSHYLVLLMAYKGGAIEHDFTAAIPQVLLSLPAHIDGPTMTQFVSETNSYDGDLYTIRLGDIRIELVVYQGRLVGMFIEAQAVRAYNPDFFPNGITLDIEEEEAPIVEGVEQEVTFENEGIPLAGTLTLPKEMKNPVPGVLFIHGSGPVDRNENATGLEINLFRELAHSLAKAGIGSLRYDKRDVGKSEGLFTAASMEDLLSDARAALSALQAVEGIDAERCFLVGHSEGGVLAPIIASEDNLTGIVLLAGTAHSLDIIIRGQVERANRAAEKSEEEVQAALAQEDQYLDFVRTSDGEWPDYPFDDLKGAMPWLTQEMLPQITALSLSWLREHFLHDPIETIQQVSCPVLILQGEKDSQVPADEANLLAAALAAAGNADVTLDLFPDLNHLMRHHPEEPNLIYRHLDEPVDPRVIEGVTGWISEHIVQ
jgi:dienelactone hydrolase